MAVNKRLLLIPIPFILVYFYIGSEKSLSEPNEIWIPEEKIPVTKAIETGIILPIYQVVVIFVK
jgi:hypothetical protein